MATTLKMLGSGGVSVSASWLPVYQCPPAKGAVCSGFTAANPAATDDTLFVRVTKSGGSPFYLVPGSIIRTKDTLLLPLFVLSAGDLVEAKAGAGPLDLIPFGSETDQ